MLTLGNLRWASPPTGSRIRRKAQFGVAAVVACAVTGVIVTARPPSANAQPQPINLLEVATEFNNPIGIDYHEPSGKLVLSVNYSNGLPHNFELVAPDGSREQFSAARGWSDEVKIGTVRSSACQGGFEAGTLFTGTGNPGVVARIASDGASFDSRWVDLPNESGLMRGALFQDRYCVVGGDLVVVTTEGTVWRITSDGRATLMARLNTHLEGVTTVPADPRYGPWAGKVLAGAEEQRRIYAIAPDGTIETFDLGIAPEDLDVVEPGEHFYGVEFAAKKLLGAVPDEFNDKVGDILIAEESGALWSVRWNPSLSQFDTAVVARVTQWEHVTFAPASIALPTLTPSPTLPATSTPTATPTAPPTPSVTPAPIYLPGLLRLRCTLQRADVVLVMDASTSMLAAARSGGTKMDAARAAAVAFIGLLDMPHDRSAVVWFNETAEVEQPLTGSRDLVAAALARIENHEFTRIDLGLSKGVDALAPILGQADRRPVMVLLTDGRSNPVPPQMAIDVAQAARERGITIYAIGLGADADAPTLTAVASGSGRVYLTLEAEDLASIYEQIALELECIEEVEWP